MLRIKGGLFKDAWEAFYNFFFPKSVRWYRYPDKSVKFFRYPASGSEPINHESNYFDYKTAYRDSIHNVRYMVDLHPQDQTFVSVGHAYSDSIEDSLTPRLISTGFLQRKDKNDAKAVETAKENYQKEFGVSAEQRYVVDNSKFDEVPLDSREGIAQSLRVFMKKAKEINSRESYSDNLHDIYNPIIFQFKTYDYHADDPVLRQTRLDLEYYLEEATESRREAGRLLKFSGDANYWRILDNSFSAENIRLVQSKIGDTVTELDPHVIEHNRHKDDTHRQGVVVFPVKTQYIE